jgi:hypothetical protein
MSHCYIVLLSVRKYQQFKLNINKLRLHEQFAVHEYNTAYNISTQKGHTLTLLIIFCISPPNKGDEEDLRYSVQVSSINRMITLTSITKK